MTDQNFTGNKVCIAHPCRPVLFYGAVRGANGCHVLNTNIYKKCLVHLPYDVNLFLTCLSIRLDILSVVLEVSGFESGQHS
jgi:hypothetical protein